MRVLVLGANGYLGKKIIGYLSASHDVTGAYRKIPGEATAIKKIGADLGSIRRALQEDAYDWVVNCVTAYEHANVPSCEIVDANMVFALHALDCAVGCGVRGFLTFDTGLPGELNLYSFTKKQMAGFGRFYSEKYGVTFLNVVLEMFYGEDEPEGRFLSGVCRKMVRGEGLELTAGLQRRDIIHVDDVCSAIFLLLGSGLDGFWDIPLGCGEAVPVRRMVEYMHTELSSTSKLDFGALPVRVGEPDCMADITLLKGMGFEPRYPWKEGLRRLCENIAEKINKSGKV